MKKKKSSNILITGFPNVGKSSLINFLLKRKISIVSSKVQTTNENIQAVLNHNDCQMIKIFISDEILKEDKSVLEDLILAAHNNAKEKLKSKTTEEISKSAGNFGIPGFKWPL